MKDFLKAIFYDVNGKPSSKRIFGALAFVLGAVVIFIIRDPALVWPCFTMAGGVFGFSVAEKIKSND